MQVTKRGIENGMYRFLAQPKFIYVYKEPKQVGYEFFLREKTPEGLRLPADLTKVTADDLRTTLANVLEALPQDLQFISVNLEPAHFVNDDFIQTIITLQKQYRTRFIAELVERTDPDVTDDNLLAAAKKLSAAGVGVCLDDIGTGSNVGARVDILDDYVDEYKFAIQDMRPFASMSEISDKLTYWYNRAHRGRKSFAVEGIETQSELNYINNSFPGMLLQGYFLDNPTLLPSTEDDVTTAN